MELLYALILLVIIVGFVSMPLLSGRTAGPGEDPVLAEIEASKEAKYREIQDLELDRGAGKLDEDEYQRQRTRLRREAADILARERIALNGEGDAESGGSPA